MFVIAAARPAAVNLAWAVERMRAWMDECGQDDRTLAAGMDALAACDNACAALMAMGQIKMVVAGARSVPTGVGSMNMALDVTPADLISGIITEAGVLQAPLHSSISAALKNSGANLCS